MKTNRLFVPVAMLLVCGGILGFALGIAATRPAAARADDAKAALSPAQTDQVDPTGQTGRAAAEAAEGKVLRFGSMIGLRPEKKEEYIRLHAKTWPEILATLKKCHIRNYSIYLGEVDGKLYLFSYFEYTGKDIAKEMAAMKADAKFREWWTLTDPCQIRLPGTKEGEWWKRIPEVFHTD